MKRKGFTVEQTIRMLREAAVHPSQGKSVKLLSREPATHRDQLRWAWDRKATKTGLALPPRYHDLRHTWKRNARRSGMHLEIQETILGHSTRTRNVSERYGRSELGQSSLIFFVVHVGETFEEQQRKHVGLEVSRVDRPAAYVGASHKWDSSRLSMGTSLCMRGSFSSIHWPRRSYSQ